MWTKCKKFFKSKIDLKKFSPLYTVLFVVLTLYVLSFLWFLFNGIMTTLKEPLFEFTLNRTGLPSYLYFQNYATVFQFFAIKGVPSDSEKVVTFVQMLGNSVIYAVGNAVIRSCVLFIVAYAAARFKFFIGKVIYTIVIVGMILPVVGAQPSMLAVAYKLGLYDSQIGVYIQKAHFLGLHFLILHATLASFPKDYDEAAQIDGASNLSVMFRIMWPLSMTTFATILLLNFITEWNDYTTPLLFLPSSPTISLGLRKFEAGDVAKLEGASVDTTLPPIKMAACFISAMPTLLLFIIFHDRLLTNLSVGGVKE